MGVWGCFGRPVVAIRPALPGPMPPSTDWRDLRWRRRRTCDESSSISTTSTHVTLATLTCSARPSTGLSAKIPRVALEPVRDGQLRIVPANEATCEDLTAIFGTTDCPGRASASASRSLAGSGGTRPRTSAARCCETRRGAETPSFPVRCTLTGIALRTVSVSPWVTQSHRSGLPTDPTFIPKRPPRRLKSVPARLLDHGRTRSYLNALSPALMAGDDAA